jgi:ankyrin repeat protein
MPNVAIPEFPGNKEDEKKFYNEIYTKLGNHIFIKSVRFDGGSFWGEDFWGQFVMGILEEKYLAMKFDKERIRKNPRIGATGNYKITRVKQGDDYVYKVVKNDSSYKGQFTPEQKRGFSKKQSTSVVSNLQGHYAPVFGHNRDRNTELTGVIFFSDDVDKNLDPNVLASLIMKYDGATAGRPYHHGTLESATKFLEIQKTSSIFHPTIDQFIVKEKDSSTNEHNEVLARLKWTSNAKCHIGIFNDNLKSRLIAQLRAKDMMYNTEQQFMPISFYIPTNKNPNNKFYPYYVEEQEKDLKEGLNSQDPEIKKIALLTSLLKDPKSFDFSQINVNFWPFLFGKKITSITKQQILPLFLLNYKDFDVNSADNNQKTPLHYAIEAGDQRTIELLLGFKEIDINKVDNNGNTPLHYAIVSGDQKTIKLLLSLKEIDINKEDKRGHTAIFYAIVSGDQKTIELLLGSKEIDINKEDKRGHTAIFYAIENNDEKTFKALLSHESFNMLQLDMQKNPNLLVIAFNSRKAEIAKVILNFSLEQESLIGGISKNMVEILSFAVNQAVQQQDLTIFQMLLSSNNKNIQNEAQARLFGLFFLDEVAYGQLKSLNDVTYLKMLSLISKPNFKNIHSHAKMLLPHKDMRENINRLNKYIEKLNQNPGLISFIKENNLKIVEYLLNNGHDINACGIDKKSPIYVAISDGNIKMIELLLKHNPDEKNFTSFKDNNLIALAIRLGSKELIEVLLQHMHKNNYKITPKLYQHWINVAQSMHEKSLGNGEQGPSVYTELMIDMMFKAAEAKEGESNSSENVLFRNFGSSSNNKASSVEDKKDTNGNRTNKKL